MRAKLAVPVLLVGLAVAIGGFLWRWKDVQPASSVGNLSPAPTEPAAIALKEARTERPLNSGPDEVGATASGTKVPDAVAPESPEDQHAAYVQSRASELMDLAMSDDADSLRAILSELTNRDPQIRDAAVQAAIQFGSRDAIPALMDAAIQTDDLSEKVAINDAIRFLNFPSTVEAVKQGN